jgi:hypothetical protein
MDQQIGTRLGRSPILLGFGPGLLPHSSLRESKPLTILARAIALVALALVAGCSAPYYIVLINATGHELQVVDQHSKQSVRNGSTFDLKLDENTNKIHFVVNGKRFHYEWIPAPANYIERNRIRKGFVIQIDAALAANLVQPGTRAMVQPSVQPSGFPLLPVQ